MPPQVKNVRGWLQPILRGAAKINYPWTKLYEELKLVEPVYRKLEMGRDYRSYVDAYKKGERLKFIGSNRKVGRASFTDTRAYMSKRYKYNVETSFIDRDNRVYSRKSTFVVSDRSLTRGEIESIARGRLGDIARDYDIPTVKATITEAWHREGDFWD